MTWAQEVEEILRRRALASQMGGAEGIERQHGRGKLTVRERIDLLSDPKSFQEFMALTGGAVYKDGALAEFTPKPYVGGMCRINGRRAILSGDDFTIRGATGSGAEVGAVGAEMGPVQRAREWRVPYVRLIDSGGGSVASFEHLGRSYLPDGNAFLHNDVSLLSLVPVVSAVLGAAAGIRALETRLAHFSVMPREIGQVFAGGPPVVKAALHQDVTKEDLGGWLVHATQSGVVDNVADSERDAFEQVRRFLSYLPQSVYEMPPRGEASDRDRREEDLLSIIPRERRRIYDVHRLINLIVDDDSFFEIAPLYGRGRITGLARVGGYPIGLMANNPKFGGGATDVAGGEKVIRLIRLCDTFHLPLVSLADEPGVAVGEQSERAGIESAGARLVCAVCDSRMPWITVVVRQLFGLGGACHHRPSGMFRRYAWPSARWGSMHIEGGASAAFRRLIESAPDPEARRLEIEEQLKLLESPFRTAEATGQDIIDPRETRPLLIEFLEEAQPILASQLGPPPNPWRP